MSATAWHWLYLVGHSAVSLYADPRSAANEGTLQWILPGYEEFFAPISKGWVMKGLWNSEKSANATYRPGLDALKAVDSDMLATALLAVVENGCALMVAATRDQGAIALTLLDGEQRHRVYPSNADQLNQALMDLIESFAPKASPTPPQRAKR